MRERELELESWCKCSWTLQSGAPVYSHCFIKYAYWLHTEKKSLRDPSYVHVVVPSMLVVPCQALPFDSMQIIIIIISLLHPLLNTADSPVGS